MKRKKNYKLIFLPIILVIFTLFYLKYKNNFFNVTNNGQIKVYFAGPLFSLQEVIGNDLLASKIQEISKKKYNIILPQKLEQLQTSKKEIRDQDLNTLISCEAVIFNFNGTDVDDGTLVEYMFSKFIDLPTLIVRTDYRHTSAEDKQPWNLMLKNFPRTKELFIDALKKYQEKKFNLDLTITEIAKEIVTNLDEVLKSKPLLINKQKKCVKEWIDLLIRS